MCVTPWKVNILKKKRRIKSFMARRLLTGDAEQVVDHLLEYNLEHVEEGELGEGVKLYSSETMCAVHLPVPMLDLDSIFSRRGRVWAQSGELDSVVM